MICGALTACGDKQAKQPGQAAAPEAQVQQQTQTAPMAQKRAQSLPFANANKAPTEETQRMADLLNKSGKAGGSLVDAVQSREGTQ